MKYFRLFLGGSFVVIALTIAGSTNQSYNIRLILDGEVTGMFWIVQGTFILIPLITGILLIRKGMKTRYPSQSNKRR